MIGTVEFFNNVKGWGIIKGENSTSYFIHHVDIVDDRFFPKGKPAKFRTLAEGQRVEFDVESSTNGKHDAAKNLRIVDDVDTSNVSETESAEETFATQSYGL